MRKRILSILFLFFLIGGRIQICFGQLKLASIKCENRERPLGVPLHEFHFGWELSSENRSEVQTAYQIGIASSKGNLSSNLFDIWDSGKTKSDNSIQVPYTGGALKAGNMYFWKVRVWNKKGIPSAWSSITWFYTCLSDAGDWQNAQWIGYEDLPDSMRVAPGIHAPFADQLHDKCLKRPVSPLLRTDFIIKKKVATAFAFVCGLGQYDMSVNGKKVGKAFLAPGWTYYDKTCLYNVLDIKSFLRKGNNAIGVQLGNGFYNINRERYFKLVDAFGMPKLLSLIKITYDDGSIDYVTSNDKWRTAPSATTFNSIYGGEDFDARIEQKDWDKPGFDDKNWKPVEIVKPPLGKLVVEMDYPVAIVDSFKIVKITQPKPGVFVYDFGQNASGVPQISVKGRPGQVVKLIPGEILNEEGIPNQAATGSPYYLSYTLKGEGVETWQPRFTYYGFRYVMIEGANPKGYPADMRPEIKNVRFLHTRNSSPYNGSFTCSNKLFNKIYALINWAIKSNLQSVATDCPHREKLSWLEQDYLMGNSIHFNFDNYGLYKKLVGDLMDAQTSKGFVPDIAPEYVTFDGGFLDSPEWGSTSVISPWLLYSWYQDESIVKRAYPMMKRYVLYLQSRSDHQILSYGLGDWFDLGPLRPGEAQLTPKSLTATAIYYYDVSLLQKMAKILDYNDDVDSLTRQALEIKDAFNKRFFNTMNYVYSTGSQTAMAMPLSVGLVENKYRDRVLNNLCDSIIAYHYNLSAGDIGFHFLVDALDKGGRSEIIYKMNNRDDVPGYGYQIKKGATALTESWPALQEVSNNHLMLGHIMEWFYSGVGGIDQESNSIGFKLLRIRPQPVGDIDAARASFHSPYGWVVTKWVKQGSKFDLIVKIPVNTNANVYLPVQKSSHIYQNGKAIKMLMNNGTAVINCGSGTHHFEVR